MKSKHLKSKLLKSKVSKAKRKRRKNKESFSFNHGKKVSAFTLLECLVALLVISGSVLIIYGLSKVIHHQMISVEKDSSKDWQIFCQQLRSELEETKLEKVEQNFLYVNKKGKTIRFGLVGESFRKTDGKGQGYQPMLHGVKGVTIFETDKSVKLQVSLEKGERTFLYKFLDKNK